MNDVAKAAVPARQRPDFNAMTRVQMLESFGDTVDRSDHTGKGDKRHPHKYMGFHATRGEINAAISQIKGAQSFDIEDSTSRRRSVVDTLRTFVAAVRVPEWTKAAPGVPAVETGHVLTGVSGLEAVSNGFGKGSSRLIGVDRDAVKDILAKVPERADVQEHLLNFRSAMGHSLHRQDGLRRAMAAAAKPRTADKAAVGR